MKKIHLKLFDVLIILFLIIFGVLLTIKGLCYKGSKIIVNANGVQYEYSGEKNGIFTVQGRLGPTTFEIKNGRVKILESACPNKNCVNQGWNNPLVCLPNKVIITIQNQDEIDAISE